MNKDKPMRVSFRLRQCKNALFFIGSFFLLMYIIIGSIRLFYPFELEWMEGGAVVHVQRILDAQPIYVEPSLNFIPFLYTPLYWYASSLAALVTGNGFMPLRFVSFAASIGCFSLIFLIVRRRTASLYAAFIACCLFAASFHIAGAWFDIARVDSLFLFLLLAGMYSFDSPRMLLRCLVSPSLLFLSFFTKQPALIIAIALSITACMDLKHSAGGFRISRRFQSRAGSNSPAIGDGVSRDESGPVRRCDRLIFLLVFWSLFAASFFLMNHYSQGWYGYYVFDLPGQHKIASGSLISYWTRDIFANMAVAVWFGLVYFLDVGHDTNRPARRIHDALLLGSLFLASYLSKLHTGGADNVLMPVFAGIAIYFGIGFNHCLKRSDGVVRFEALIIVGAILQFLALFYWPQKQLPTSADRMRGDKLLQTISGFHGEVFFSDHPWYLALAGKPTQAQAMAVDDIMRASKAGRWKKQLEEQFAAAIADRRYQAFFVESKNFNFHDSDFKARYMLMDKDYFGGEFVPVTGGRNRPVYFYVLRSDRHGVEVDTAMQRR